MYLCLTWLITCLSWLIYDLRAMCSTSKTHHRQMPMASSANADCPQTTIGKCRWYHRQMLMAPRPHRQMPMTPKTSSANADDRPRPHRQMPIAAKTSSANADDGVLSTDVRVLRLGTSGLRLTTVQVTCFLFSLRR